MRIVDRVEQIREGEHERLRQAIYRLDSALRVMAEEEEQELQLRETPSYDLFGERRSQPEPLPPSRRKSIIPLQLAWAPLEGALLSRLDRWEEHLLPLCQQWMDGAPLEEELREHAIAVIDARTRIE